MYILRGEFNEAKIFAAASEKGAEDQILTYLNTPLFFDTKVAIMPDVHVGKGSVVGFTATINEYAVPSIVGVDIGCGVSAVNLKKGAFPFDKLDKFIRKNVPAGRGVNRGEAEYLERAFEYACPDGDYTDFIKQVALLAEKTHCPKERTVSALGSLGGGNHFIEVDTDEEKNRWLLIHSGSRALGNVAAAYHMDIAIKRTASDCPIKFLVGAGAEEYIEDMKTAQAYARVNRAAMAMKIAFGFFKRGFEEFSMIDTVHNYIDFERGVVRKGAVSAAKGEKFVIPFSMADGAILCVGKGNADWNYSAPHGSGRKLSRTQAAGLSLEEFQKRMKHVWSSSVSKSTLDESPMAYKRVNDILEHIMDTAEIESRLTPAYNFKSG